jgi:hypothetical protein
VVLVLGNSSSSGRTGGVTNGTSLASPYIQQRSTVRHSAPGQNDRAYSPRVHMDLFAAAVDEMFLFDWECAWQTTFLAPVLANHILTPNRSFPTRLLDAPPEAIALGPLRAPSRY